MLSKKRHDKVEQNSATVSKTSSTSVPSGSVPTGTQHSTAHTSVNSGSMLGKQDPTVAANSLQVVPAVVHGVSSPIAPAVNAMAVDIPVTVVETTSASQKKDFSSLDNNISQTFESLHIAPEGNTVCNKHIPANSNNVNIEESMAMYDPKIYRPLDSVSGSINKKHRYQTLLDHGYKYFEKLGEGAFSKVLRGENASKDNEQVAIKIISKQKLDVKQQKSVLKEVIILKKLNHTNIIKFVDFYEDLKYYYIIQELSRGGEIFNQIVDLTYFSEDLSRHVICQVAEAIRYLHNEIGIVHRDIKPENLLFDPIEYFPCENNLRQSDDPATKKNEGEFKYGIGGGSIGRVQLADFGLSKQIWENKTKTPCGTVGYTAPEIVKDERYSNKIDMWALGCVLYTLLCGFPPFYDEKIDVLTEKIALGHYEFLKPWWNEISMEAKNCVKNLLCVNEAQRYDINEFFEDPWVLEFLEKLPKDEATGKHIYTGYDKILEKQQKEIKKQEQDLSKATKKYAIYRPMYYSPALESPAGIRLKDAFDISTALHRENEEKKMKGKRMINPFVGTPLNDNKFNLLEEDEEMDDEGNEEDAAILNRINKQHHVTNDIHEQIPKNHAIFELNLDESSIIQRRKNEVQT